MRSKPQRFRIERMGETFVVIDTVACKFSEFASRQDAELECEARNGTAKPKTSEPAEILALREKFRKVGISCEEAEAFDQPRARDIKSERRSTGESQSVENARKWLPRLLRAWARDLAIQSGMEDARRRSMRTDSIVDGILVAAGRGAFSFRNRTIQSLGEKVRMNWARPYGADAGWLLLIHYASADPARLKAEYWGLSERDYFRKIDAAHRWLARNYGSENDFEWSSAEDTERYAGRSFSPDDDFAGLWIDRNDLANLGS